MYLICLFVENKRGSTEVAMMHFCSLVFQLHSNSGISALNEYKPVQTCHSQAILVSKLLRQIANAWNADRGYR